jgi:hypothetical protein
MIDYVSARSRRYDLLIKGLLYGMVVANIMLLSSIFLYPRLVFMVTHWGASEREILLSEGPADNPNMEHLRKIYKLLYFVRDHSEEDSTVNFINPHFSKAEAYKVLLPRRVHFLELHDRKDLLLPIQKGVKKKDYFIFIREDKPDGLRENEIIWDESGWGLYKINEPLS